MKHKFIYKSILILIVTFLIAFPCSSARAGLISTEQEIELGREAARQVEAEYGLYNDPVMTAWVEKVGKKLAYSSPREGITYSFKVLNMEEPNAFAIPGGFVYVTSGLMKNFVKNNEDYLAVILGHELGHINERHGMSQLEWSLGLGIVLNVLLGDNGTVAQIAQVASNLIFLKYNREQELEADESGMRLAYNNGYNPRALIQFFKDLRVYEKQNPNYTPEFMASHPDTESRIEDANKYIAELEGKTYNPDTADNSYQQPTPVQTYENNSNFTGDLNGIWKAEDGTTLNLKQNGNYVTGTYQRGSIQGEIKDNKINYDWWNRDGENGKGYFAISSDENTLEGEWSSTSGKSGHWKLFRNEISYDNNYSENNEGNIDISGKWQSSIGEINFIQNGDKVEGTYGKGKGVIKGTLNGKRLDCEWYEVVDKEGGSGYFIISDDGKSMKGEWGSEVGAKGQWNAYR
jgi:Zn-dependent protease with chaperone function